MNFPQLRVRTGYTFRDAYGKIEQVIERVKEVGAQTFGIVDSTTWGHIAAEKAAVAAGINVGFGAEIPINVEVSGKNFKPRAWTLARAGKTSTLYNMTSAASGKGISIEELRKYYDAIRFVGGCADYALEGCFDYADINPASLVTAGKNRDLARRWGLPMVITGYNDMPRAEDAYSAYSWHVGDSVGARHIQTIDEIRNGLGSILSAAEFDSAIENAFLIENQIKGSKLKKAPIINLEGDLRELCIQGKEKRLKKGHIKEWTAEYEERLNTELEQIKLKEFDSYFLMVGDLVRWAKQHMLVGPARGSSAGSLVCYLVEITEVDPIVHHLLFQRFIDISRADFPDIDIDFPDTKRPLVFDYLTKKYGVKNVAKVGNISTLQPASILAQLGDTFRINIDETQAVKQSVIEYAAGDAGHGHSMRDTFSKTDAGIKFKNKYPVAAKSGEDLELHPSHASVHAAGILVCNDPVTDYCTVTHEGVACVDKFGAEYLNLLKIDALGLRTLGVIEDANVMSNDELYSLNLDDQKVLDILNEDKVSGVFQFEGDAVRSVTRMIKIDNFSKIDNLTALARPGPMSSGMWRNYIDRVNGKEKITFNPPQLEKYLSETYGVLLYQEQIMNIVKEIGGFDWAKTSEVRKAMAKSKGEEYFSKIGADFSEGAEKNGIAHDDAMKLWEAMKAFGQYSFNKSHSLSYAVVTYWTMYLKRYYPLEYAAACLRSAKDDEQVIAILRELRSEGVQYTAIDPDKSDINWKVSDDGRLIGGIMNAVGFGRIKALTYVMKREKGTITEKERERLINAKVKFSDLNEAHTLFGPCYKDSSLLGVTSGNPIENIADIRDGDTGLVIGKLRKKSVEDENDAKRIKRRGGKLYKNKSSVFADFLFVDDSVNSPVKFRIRPELYELLGRNIVEECPIDSWFLIKAWKLPEFDMFIIKNIKRIA